MGSKMHFTHFHTTGFPLRACMCVCMSASLWQHVCVCTSFPIGLFISHLYLITFERIFACLISDSFCHQKMAVKTFLPEAFVITEIEGVLKNWSVLISLLFTSPNHAATKTEVYPFLISEEKNRSFKLRCLTQTMMGNMLIWETK